MGKAAAGESVRDISEWLLAERNIAASAATVARYIQKLSIERASAARGVARTKLAKSVTSDLDRLEMFAQKAIKIAGRLEDKDPDLWCKVAREARAFIEAKLKLSGAGSDDVIGKHAMVVMVPQEECGDE